MKTMDEHGLTEPIENSTPTFLTTLLRFCFPIFILICLPKFLSAQQNSNNSEIITEMDSTSQRSDTSSLRIGFSYGWSGRINSLDGSGNSEINDFEKELRAGQAIRSSLHYFPEGNFGIGLKYAHFFTAHEADVKLFDDVGLERTVTVSENINARFFGLSFMHSEPISSKFEVNLSIALGVFFLKSELEGIGLFPITFNGDSFALDGELNLEYHLAETVSIGMGAGINLGPIREMQDDDIIVQSFDFNRIDLFGGLRFHF
jgi:hypothetical protein